MKANTLSAEHFSKKRKVPFYYLGLVNSIGLLYPDTLLPTTSAGTSRSLNAAGLLELNKVLLPSSHQATQKQL